MNQESIEILDIPTAQCRNCKSFIRVRDCPNRSDNDTPYDNIVMRNGFCLLGRYMEGGDFTLFYNDRDPPCKNYTYDLYNAETTQNETLLKDYIRNLTKDVWDRRTKEYKLLDNYRKSLKDSSLIAKLPTSILGVPINDKDMQNALYRLQDDKLIEYTAKLYLGAVCRTQLSYLAWRKSMKYKEYCKILGKIRFELSDAFEKSIQNMQEVHE